MKISTTLLKQFVNLDKDEIKNLSDTFTFLSYEVEGVKPESVIKNVKVGKVLECQKHPNADKLNYCKVQTEGKIYDVICGGANIAPGQIVAHAIPGSIVGEMELLEKELRGITSAGMILSISEIAGLEKKVIETEEQSNIYVFDKEFKNSISSELNLDGQILELSILPDRTYAKNYLMLAKELSVVLNKDFKIPNHDVSDVKTKKITEDIKIELKEKFTSINLSNIKIKESKTLQEIKSVLYHSGIQPKNTIEDIISFVSLITGNVIYYVSNDLKKITGNNRTLLLENSSNKKQEIDLINSGVMLSNENEGYIISSSSNFKSNVINEKNINPQFGKIQISGTNSQFTKLSIELFVYYANKSGYLVNYSNILENKLIEKLKTFNLTSEFIELFIGKKLDLNEVYTKLTKLGFVIEGESFTIPDYRFDITTKEDVIEEIVRIFGVNNIVQKGVDDHVTALNTLIRINEEKHKQAIDKINYSLVNNGFFEAKTYQLINEQDWEKYNIWDVKDKVLLDSKYNFEFNVMRNSLFSSLLNVHVHNYRKEEQDIRIFEISNVYFNGVNNDPKLVLGVLHDSKIYEQEPILALKMIMNNIFKDFNLEKKDIKIIKNNNEIFNIFNSATILYKNKEIAKIGEVHPKILRENKYIRIDKIKEKLFYLEIIIENII